MIKHNHPVPVEEKITCKTNRDNQTFMNFTILQGESNFAAKNFHVGDLTLKNIPKMPKGELEVSFTLKMDQKGDLSATAELKLEDGKILSSSLTIDQRNSSMKDDKIDAIKGREEMMIAHS